MTCRYRVGHALASLLALLATAACGFHLAGRGTGAVPEHIKVIALVPFENRTQRPEIEQRVTEQVANALVKRGRYRVVTSSENADALLEGAINQYRTSPVQFTAEGRATRVEAVISMEATFRDLANDEVLWSQSGLLFREQYDVAQTGEFIEEETVALDEIAEGAAEALVASIFEGF